MRRFGAAVRGQCLQDQLQSARRLLFDAMFGNSQPGCDLALRHALDPPQLEDFAAARGQGIDQLPDSFQFAPRARAPFRAGILVFERHCLHLGQAVDAHDPVAPDPLEHRHPGGGEQIRPSVANMRDALQPRDVEIGILHDIVDLPGRRRHAPQARAQSSLVRDDIARHPCHDFRPTLHQSRSAFLNLTCSPQGCTTMEFPTLCGSRCRT